MTGHPIRIHDELWTRVQEIAKRLDIKSKTNVIEIILKTGLEVKESEIGIKRSKDEL